MSLPERDQEILREIERSLASAEPHLDRALSTGRLPALRLAPIVDPHHAERKRYRWAALAVVSLLAGIVLLVAGLMLNALALTWAGITLAQFGPSAIAFIYRKRRNRRVGDKTCGQHLGYRGENPTGKERD